MVRALFRLLKVPEEVLFCPSGYLVAAEAGRSRVQRQPDDKWFTGTVVELGIGETPRGAKLREMEPADGGQWMLRVEVVRR